MVDNVTPKKRTKTNESPLEDEQPNKKPKLEPTNSVENGEVDAPVWCLKKAQEEQPSRHCPYLDTIDRFLIFF